ncbi:MAG: glycine C-acetyltransferase [Rubricoccaceae bacterium]|nr:glycine C-acetyltransferase [Rubricoccaceae bacterium]
MSNANSFYSDTLAEIREAGLYKEERVIASQQAADIVVAENGSSQEVINFCANNYLGLTNHPDLIKAAQDGVAKYGFGLSSVRFICGTQTIHKELEKRLADFHRKDDAILYAACFDANTGLFETLLGPEDAIISDALNHASIIDGVRLCKAERFRFAHADMADLERCLKESQDARIRCITTDGVFSMDGDVARLDEICALAEKYNAIVHVDECHATGFFGSAGRGAAEYKGVLDKVDIITSTLGKALGGGSGGFTVASQQIVDLLRQRSRPYLFSNSVAPAIVYASLKVLDMLEGTGELRERLNENTRYFREQMTAAGFDIKPGEHPIVPIMLYDAKLAQDVARDLLEEGIYVIGFSFPVVPKGEARIRVQVSAAHSKEHLDGAVAAFTKVGKQHGVV